VPVILTRWCLVVLVTLSPCHLVTLSLQAAESSPLDPLVRLLGKSDDADVQRDVLKGMQAGLDGRRRVAMPADWPAVSRKLRSSGDAEVRDLALNLSLLFGDPEALATLRKTAADASAPSDARRAAVQALVRTKDPDVVALLQGLLADKDLRGPAIRGLATYADDRTPGLILKLYPALTEAEKGDAVNTLASRPAYAGELIKAVEDGKVPAADLTNFTVRQIHGMGDKELSARLTKAWGLVRSPSLEKVSLIARYKKQLTPDVLKKADPSHGRAVFARTCSTCHVLFDAGGKIGPELTGGQRANLDYVLENVLDPSAVLVTVVEMKDGRVVNGIVRREDDKTVTLQTPNDLVAIPKDEIDERRQSAVSLMPEGLLDKLTADEVRDLVAYLASPVQVPLPKEEPPKKP
jgi:putative heme-binding domain-containing protein